VFEECFQNFDKIVQFLNSFPKLLSKDSMASKEKFITDILPFVVKSLVKRKYSDPVFGEKMNFFEGST